MSDGTPTSDPLRVDKTVLSRAVDQDLVLYHPQTDEVTHLDPIAARIWHELAAGPTLDELVATLTSAFNADADVVRSDTKKVLVVLAEAKLLVTN